MAVSLLACFFVLAIMGGMVLTGAMTMMTDYMSVIMLEATGDISQARIHNLITDALKQIFIIAWPLLAIGLVAGVGVNLVQVGFLFAPEGIKPKFSKINPLQGFKRIFSMRSLVELLKNLLKVSILAVVLWLDFSGNLKLFPNLMLFPPAAVGSEIFNMSINLAFKACAALAIIGAFDYLYQWWEFEKNLKMTKQEIKDEYKQTEGDPKIKGAIKRKQREMSMRRMMANLPKADVVITNPTHYAVALEYKDGESEAPVVLAKGKDLIAQTIKKRALELAIPTVENRPVAQALYASCEVGDKIPGELFGAVAEILAYVYLQKQKRAG